MANQVGRQDDSLTQAEKIVLTADESLNGRLADLRNIVETVGASWQGKTQVAFDSVMLGFDKKGREMSQILVDLANSVKGANFALNEAEEASTLHIQNYGSLLGSGN